MTPSQLTQPVTPAPARIIGAEVTPSSPTNSKLAPAPASDPLPVGVPVGVQASACPISPSERFQLLAQAVRILREETIAELESLSALCPPDDFCTGCCAISKEVSCLNSALFAGQFNIRTGAPFRGHVGVQASACHGGKGGAPRAARREPIISVPSC